MKKILIFIFAAFAFAATGQNNLVKNAMVGYSAGAPTFSPGSFKANEIAIDTVTGAWYEWKWTTNYTAGSWIASGYRVQTVAGCSAPLYTPGKLQSRLVINGCPTPELYYYTGAAWVQVGGASYTGGYGINISGTVISADTSEVATIYDATHIDSTKIITGGVGKANIAANTVGSSELISTGVIPGSYGGSANVPVLTVDADGRITAITTTGATSIQGHHLADDWSGISHRDTLNFASGATTTATVTNTTGTHSIRYEISSNALDSTHVKAGGLNLSDIGQSGASSGNFVKWNGSAWVPGSEVDGSVTNEIELPSQTGNSGKYLTTNGSAASWATVSASPGGSSGHVQYNSSGSFAGSSNFTWSSPVLTVTGRASVLDASNNSVFNNAGGSFTTASQNIIAGKDAGRLITSGSTNTAIGVNAMYTAKTAGANFALGLNTLYDCTSCNSNIAIGNTALGGLIDASSSIGIGSNSGLFCNVNHSYQIGTSAGYYNNGIFNTFYGYLAGYGASKATTTGGYNVGIGYEALKVFTSGAGNVGIGKNAGSGITTGSNNVVIGSDAFDVASTASGNVAIGKQAGESITSGLYNTCINYSGAKITTGGFNTAIGFYANGEGEAGANYSVCIGYNAGGSATELDDNIFIGRSAGSTNTYSRVIGIGLNSTPTANNQIRIGSSDYDHVSIPTKASVGTGAPAASAALEVSSTTGGLLLPRMTTAQRDAIGSPAAGLMIFNTTTSKFQGYDGSTWVDLH